LVTVATVFDEPQRQSAVHWQSLIDQRPVSVMVLPGIDQQHPREVGALYVRHLRHPLVVEQTAPNKLAQVAAFCTDPLATLAK
jgi:hypothetical protein